MQRLNLAAKDDNNNIQLARAQSRNVADFSARRFGLEHSLAHFQLRRQQNLLLVPHLCRMSGETEKEDKR